MCPPLRPAVHPDSRAVEWNGAVDGLWVATIDGGYAGSVSVVAGTFVTRTFVTRTDLGVVIESFAELLAAQRCLVAHVCHPSSPFSRSLSPDDTQIRPPKPYRRGSSL